MWILETMTQDFGAELWGQRRDRLNTYMTESLHFSCTGRGKSHLGPSPGSPPKFTDLRSSPWEGSACSCGDPLLSRPFRRVHAEALHREKQGKHVPENWESVSHWNQISNHNAVSQVQGEWLLLYVSLVAERKNGEERNHQGRFHKVVIWSLGKGKGGES